MRATIPMLPFLQGVQPMTNRSSPILQTWAFLVTVTITHEHNTTQQSRCWGDRPLSITHLSLHLLLCVSVCPSSMKVANKSWLPYSWSHHMTNESTSERKNKTHSLSSFITYHHPFTCNYFLNPFNALSPFSFHCPHSLPLSLYHVCQQPVYIVAPSKISLFVCVCVSLWITTLIERLNSLYYIM